MSLIIVITFRVNTVVCVVSTSTAVCLIIIQIVRQRAEEAIDAGDHGGGGEGDNSDDYNYYNKNDVENFCPNVSLSYDHSVNYSTS